MIKTTQRKERALQALLVSRTKAEAAKAAGIGLSTLREYMKDEEFITAYREAVAEVLEGTTRKAQTAAGQAVDVLQEIMSNTNEQAGARVQAADKILNHAQRLTESLDTAERMEQLEAAISEMENRR